MIRLFISHSYERDREFVSALRATLKQHGDVEILDPANSVASGSEIASAIIAQIERCDVVLSMVGTDRPNILLETGIALGAGKDLLLVASAVDSFPVNLRSLPVVILSGDPKADCPRVVRRLLAMRLTKKEKEKTYSSALEKLGAYRNDPHFFDSMPPTAFEQLIAEVFEQQGFEVALSRQAADAGFDIMVRRRTDHQLVAIQVKKYSRQSRVSIGHVRELLGAAVLNKADIAVLVTSSPFTAGAEAMAAQSTTPRLVLVTMDRLLDAPDIGGLLTSAAIPAMQTDRRSAGG